MQIEVVGRGFDVDSEVRERIRKRFQRVERQVSEHSRLEVVLRQRPVADHDAITRGAPIAVVRIQREELDRSPRGG